MIRAPSWVRAASGWVVTERAAETAGWLSGRRTVKRDVWGCMVSRNLVKEGFSTFTERGVAAS